jgi:fluoroquinolone resistance protein
VDWTKAGDAVISKLFLSVHFDDCLLNYAAFFGLTLRRSRFAGCIAREVDFREADLTEAVCTRTDFTGSKFHHTNLTKADFRHATAYTINPATNTVTKARFSLPEAVSLLNGFDIVIE